MPEDINFQEAMEAAGITPMFIDSGDDAAQKLSAHLRKTNVQFVDDIMNFCPFGALGQVIVIQAVEQFCLQIAQASLEELEHPLINPEAYKRAAEWVLEQYKQQYGD